MIGIGEGIAHAIMLALWSTGLAFLATFLWMMLLNPFRSRPTATRTLIALAAGILSAMLVILLIRWFHGMLEIFLWIAAAATIGAFAVLLRKVLDR